MAPRASRMLSIPRRTLSARTYRAFRTGKWSQSVRRVNQSTSATRGTGPSEGGRTECAIDHDRAGRLHNWDVQVGSGGAAAGTPPGMRARDHLLIGHRADRGGDGDVDRVADHD